MFPDRVILPWLDRLRAELPDLELFDVHTHIGGNDPDGFTCAPEELLDALQRANARAVVFPMHEPGGYPSANDRVISEAKASGGRLVAFCRVNPEEDAVAEVEP